MAQRPGPDSPRPAPTTVALGAALARTVTHFFPKWNLWAAALPDPRDPRKITYPLPVLLWAGVLIGLLRLGARRQLRFVSQTPAFVDNLHTLAGVATLARAPDPQTLANCLAALPPEAVQGFLQQCGGRLLRMKVLDGSRLQGAVLVAVDGTGMLVFKTRHCDHCLTKTKDGTIFCYYHPVLEAKLVTPSGLAISLATEFIANPTPDVSKQDCERAAFGRLTTALKRAFPQLRICLLLDALYACEPVLARCRTLGWRYLITFKPGAGPDRWDEWQRLKALAPANRRTVKTPDGRTQAFAWVHGLAVGAETTHVLECVETPPAGTVTTFVWLTNCPMDGASAPTLANDGGRCRWVIENQGFNEQKCGGFALEHAYSEDWETEKNFYLLLQLAHLLDQLLVHGNLLRRALGQAVRKALGGTRVLGRYLLESLRHRVISAEALAATRIQIRLDSS